MPHLHILIPVNQTQIRHLLYKQVFDQLNYTLQQITGYAVDPDDMFYRNMDTLNENIRLYNKKVLKLIKFKGKYLN